jgi:hypothetical protein
VEPQTLEHQIGTNSIFLFFKFLFLIYFLDFNNNSIDEGEEISVACIKPIDYLKYIDYNINQYTEATDIGAQFLII